VPRSVGTSAAVTAGCAAILAGVVWAHTAGIDAPTARASIESLFGMCGAVAAGLLASRFAVTHELRDLFLIAGVSVLTIVSVLAYGVPAALNLQHGGSLTAAAPAGVLFASIGFWLAARTPSGRPARARARLIQTTLAISVLAGALAAALGVASNGWIGRTTFALASSALLLHAALVVWRRDSSDAKRGESWLAGGLAMLGIAQLYAATLPLLAPGWVSPREPLRLAGVVMIFVAAVIEEREARLAAARLAVIAERRRVAGDLHDGIAQDLAFIAAHASRLLPRAGEGEHPVGIAARRALALSRGVIDDLSDLDHRPIQEALAVLAAELSERFAIKVKIDAPADDALALDVRRELVRIVREAVVNAVKHGAASTVTVAIDRSAAGTVLRVRDDGIGIRRGNGERAPEGFGLTSVRERVAAISAGLTFNEPVGGGTEVEVALP
jgi:signal transduction histidine kinase